MEGEKKTNINNGKIKFKNIFYCKNVLVLQANSQHLNHNLKQKKLLFGGRLFASFFQQCFELVLRTLVLRAESNSGKENRVVAEFDCEGTVDAGMIILLPRLSDENPL